MLPPPHTPILPATTQCPLKTTGVKLGPKTTFFLGDQQNQQRKLYLELKMPSLQPGNICGGLLFLTVLLVET